VILVTCSLAYSGGKPGDGCSKFLRDSDISEGRFATQEKDRTATARGEPAVRMGPLRVSSKNPRYFADPSGRVVYLTGAHTWNNLVDMDSQFPPRVFDFDGYLDFLKAHNHNLTRLWAWEVTRPNDERDTPQRKIAAPQPWRRTGPGTDVSGLPKFDLTKFDPSYFQRLRSRVKAARDREVYVIIMLFEGWSVQFSPGKLSHPFYGANNINGTDYLTDVRDIHTLRYPQITRLQKRYVQAVLDTVNDLDNVLFEIANEAGAYSTEWQYAMLRFVKCYESTKPTQHPIGMTYQYRGGTNSTLFDSEADWIAPGGESGNYQSRPETSTGRKIVISDSDHFAGSSLGETLWVYRSFFQGLNVLYMDRYAGPDALNKEQLHLAPEIRAAIGQVRLIANRFDIGNMVPAANLATTGYALRGTNGILVLAPDATRFNIDLRTMSGQIRLEWFDTVTGRVSDGGTLNGGTTTILRSPSPHGAVLYLRAASSSEPSLTEIQNGAQSIRRASMRYAPWLSRVRMIAKPYLDKMADGYRILIASLVLSVFGGATLGFAGGWLCASHLSRRSLS
jgi:Family of unknown function (DUF6298)